VYVLWRECRVGVYDVCVFVRGGLGAKCVCVVARVWNEGVRCVWGGRGRWGAEIYMLCGASVEWVCVVYGVGGRGLAGRRCVCVVVRV